MDFKCDQRGKQINQKLMKKRYRSQVIKLLPSTEKVGASCMPHHLTAISGYGYKNLT